MKKGFEYVICEMAAIVSRGNKEKLFSIWIPQGVECMTTVANSSDFEITHDTPNLAIKDNLSGVYCECFFGLGEYLSCFNGTAL